VNIEDAEVFPTLRRKASQTACGSGEESAPQK